MTLRERWWQVRYQYRQIRSGCREAGCRGCEPDCDLDCLPDLDCMPDCSLLILPSVLMLDRPHRAPRRRVTGPGRVGVVAIRGYQRWLSAHLRTRCRQVPTCSNYGLEAVRRYGLVEGSRLTAARIGRCNPSTPRGTSDPVP